jgi:hypothetical protein
MLPMVVLVRQHSAVQVAIPTSIYAIAIERAAARRFEKFLYTCVLISPGIKVVEDGRNLDHVAWYCLQSLTVEREWCAVVCDL